MQSHPQVPPSRRRYRHSAAASVCVQMSAEDLFAQLDNHQQLAAHMSRSSPMMAGQPMNFVFDQGKGQQIGSRISMSGQIAGLALHVDEVVTEHDPPHTKIWETRGNPRLLVIGDYRMGFSIIAKGRCSALTVFIDYDLPGWPWRPLGVIVGGIYARWCVRSMARDARRPVR